MAEWVTKAGDLLPGCGARPVEAPLNEAAMVRRIAQRSAILAVVGIVLSCCAPGQVRMVPAPQPPTPPPSGAGHSMDATAQMPGRLTDSLALPDSIGSPAWIRAPEIQHFAGDSLYDYIDGAAEMYHKYEFVEVVAAEYRLGERVITADIYSFRRPDRSFGMYATLRPDGPDTLALGIEGFAFGPNLVFVKGAYVVNVYGYEDTDETVADTRAIAAAIEQRLVGTTRKPEMFSHFPQSRRIEFTEKIFAEAFLGQDFLRDIYTIDLSDDLSGRAPARFFLAEDESRRMFDAWRESAARGGTSIRVLSGMQLPAGWVGGECLVLEDHSYGVVLVAWDSGKMFGVVGYRPALDPKIAEFRDAILSSTD